MNIQNFLLDCKNSANISVKTNDMNSKRFSVSSMWMAIISILWQITTDDRLRYTECPCLASCRRATVLMAHDKESFSWICHSHCSCGSLAFVNTHSLMCVSVLCIDMVRPFCIPWFSFEAPNCRIQKGHFLVWIVLC